MMRLFLALLTTLALAGCLRPIQANLPRDPGPAKGPEIVVLVSKTGQAARTLIHDVAVHCWLDGIVVGAQMIVKPGGNIIIVGDRDNLIAADYLGLKGARSRWRLSGTAIADQAKTRKIVRSIDTAVKTGVTSCPNIVG